MKKRVKVRGFIDDDYTGEEPLTLGQVVYNRDSGVVELHFEYPESGGPTA